MKKSSILTFATAAAVVATTAGTFASWTSLSSSKAYQLTTGSLHTVEISSDTLSWDNTLSADATTATASFVVDTTGVSKLNLAATDVKFNNAEATGIVSVEILDDKDQAVTADMTVTEGNHTYKVKVTLANTDVDKAGKNIDFTIKADGKQ